MTNKCGITRIGKSLAPIRGTCPPFWEPMELKCSPCECVLPLSNLNSCGPAVVQVEPRPALVIVWIRSCFPLVNLRMMKWWKINERMFAFLNSLPPHKIPGKRSGSTESRSDVSGTHAWETLTKHWAETSVLKCESHQSKLKKKTKNNCVSENCTTNTQLLSAEPHAGRDGVKTKTRESAEPSVDVFQSSWLHLFGLGGKRNVQMFQLKIVFMSCF